VTSEIKRMWGGVLKRDGMASDGPSSCVKQPFVLLHRRFVNAYQLVHTNSHTCARQNRQNWDRTDPQSLKRALNIALKTIPSPTMQTKAETNELW